MAVLSKLPGIWNDLVWYNTRRSHIRGDPDSKAGLAGAGGLVAPWAGVSHLGGRYPGQSLVASARNKPPFRPTAPSMPAQSLSHQTLLRITNQALEALKGATGKPATIVEEPELNVAATINRPAPGTQAPSCRAVEAARPRARRPDQLQVRDSSARDARAGGPQSNSRNC
jgi:hypothetical protein